MQLNSENIDPHIARFLSGDATWEEMNAVDKWCAEKPENQRYFDHCVWIFSAHASVDKPFDLTKAWTNVKPKETAVISMRNTWRRYFSYAAVFVILVGVALYFISQNHSTTEIQKFASLTKVERGKLQNGGLFQLELGSNMKVSYRKEDSSQVAKLNGAAYFQMDKPHGKFTVVTSDIHIEDIGTRFFVEGFSDSDTVKVMVTEGKVKMIAPGGKVLKVGAHQVGTYVRSLKQLSIDSIQDPNSMARFTRVFVFRNTALKQAISLLNKVYEKPFVLDGNSGNCPLTVTFRDQKQGDVAYIIGGTLNLEVDSLPNAWILKGNGCNN